MACFSYEIRLILGGNMRHFLYFMRPRGLKIWKSKTACCIFVGYYGWWSPLCVKDIVCRNGKSTASVGSNATLIGPTVPRRVNADIISQWHNSAIGTAMEVLMPERNQFHTNAWGSGIAKEPLESFYRSEGRVTPSHFNSFRGHSATYPTALAVGTATVMSLRKI